MNYIYLYMYVSITYDSQASDDYHDIMHILIDTLPAHSWVSGVSTILCSQALDESWKQGGHLWSDIQLNIR